MSEYLTPAEVEAHAQHEESLLALRLAATLREMAAVVAAVADIDFGGECPFCAAPIDWDEPTQHSPDCLYLRARRLMGLEP